VTTTPPTSPSGRQGDASPVSAAGRLWTTAAARREAARSGLSAETGRGTKKGLGSERGLATPSPDAKGREPLSPVDLDHAAGTLTDARTQL